MKTKSTWKTFRNGSTIIAFVLLAVFLGLKFLTDSMGIHSRFCHDMIVACILWIGILWALIAVCWQLQFGFQTGQAMQRASQPVLTPGQIHERLCYELGREPTFSEVADVHQMLTSTHNQDMITAGAGVGLLLLANHTLHDHN